MITRLNNKLYEGFHHNIFIQKKIIKNNNFTYRNIIYFTDKYFIKRGKVLDIGCGVGTVSFYLAKKGYTVHGIDISKNAISSCKKSSRAMKIRKTKFIVANFPYQMFKGKYRYIICSEVLEHLKDDELALKKIFNLLEKGGIAVISTPSSNAPLYRVGLTYDFDKRVGHLRRYSLSELSHLCRTVGFRIKETKRTEGILRNYLFLNPVAGKLIRFINYSPFTSDIITFIDNITLKLFGESNIFIIIKKP